MRLYFYNKLPIPAQTFFTIFTAIRISFFSHAYMDYFNPLNVNQFIYNLIRFYYFLSRQICEKLLEMLKGGSNEDKDSSNERRNGVNKVLNAPVHLGSMAATLEEQVEKIKSIWVTTRDDGMVNFAFIFCNFFSQKNAFLINALK